MAAEDVAMADIKPEPSVKTEKGEDAVVVELDVYISQSLAPSLYLLQYPLRPPWRPYDQTQMTSAKMKPKQQRLNVEYAVDTKGAHYDSDSPLKTPSQVLSSTRIDSRTTYCVAALRNNELHLTPINGGILQLRPSFGHLDEADAEKKKAEEEDIAPVHGEEEEGDDDVPLAKPVTVHFKKRENEKAASARKQSHAFLRQLEDEEPWAELKRHARDSLEGNRMFDQLFTPCTDAVKFDMSAEHYISRLMPAPPAEAKGAPVGEEFSTKVQNQPLDVQLKTLFTSAGVLEYSRVKTLVKAAKSDDELLSGLSHVAALVRGVWVARSDLLYLSNPRFMHAHDLLLLILHENGVVTRKNFVDRSGLNQEDGKLVLMRVARLDPNVGSWVLKVPPEASFATNFPTVVASFEQMWADKKKHMNSNVVVEKERLPEPEAMNISGPGSTLSEQLRAFMAELFNAYGVCSQAFIKQQLELLRKNDTHPYSLLKEAKTIENDVFTRTLKSIAAQLHNAYYLKTTGNPTHDKYREVILSVFKDKVSVKKADVAKAAEEMIPDPVANTYMKVLKEFAYAKGSQWIFKSGNNDQ